VTEPVRKTYCAEEVAALLGVSDWSLYQAARTKEGLLGQLAISVGRRVVWPRAGIDKLLGLDQPPAETLGAARIRLLEDGESAAQ
jgi:hypothetical protein